MLEREIIEMGATKEVLKNHPDVFKITAPDGFSFYSNDGVHYGPVIYTGKNIGNRYNLRKDKQYNFNEYEPLQ